MSPRRGGVTTAVTTIVSIFQNSNKVVPDVSSWDTSNIVDMRFAFAGAASANPDVSGWDTSQVTDISSLFDGAPSNKEEMSVT